MDRIPHEILKKAEKWTTSPFDEKTQKEVVELIKKNPDELINSFYKDLEFGTGGMRGKMGAGSNKINKYTIGQATQGLCNYIKSQDVKTPKVAIAHDSRNNSRYFAEITAKICSANGIEVELSPSLRPTPELSFAVREMKCTAGVVITASHNPKEYNGYKVYWSDGAQLVSPQDKAIIEEVKKVSFEEIPWKQNSSLINIWESSFDQEYMTKTIELMPNLNLTKEREELKVVYTALHGTGGVIIPQLLNQAGYKNIITVAEQDIADGDFSTVSSPNPEESAALDKALKLAEKTNSEIILGTDPDADRVGVAVRDNNNKLILLNGNQTAAILIYYLLENKKDTFKGNEYICSTIVTSDILEKIALSYKVKTYKTLTGFKWIAEKIRKLEGKEKYIGGGEESYGFLIGDLVRDKDANSAALLFCEVASWCKKNGKTIFQLLQEIHLNYGFYQEKLISIVKEGKQGAEEIKNLMNSFKLNPPKELANILVESISNYETSKNYNQKTKREEIIDLPKSNVIQFHLEDGTTVTARPSGTEPKIKFYISTVSTIDEINNYDIYQAELNDKIEKIISSLHI